MLRLIETPTSSNIASFGYEVSKKILTINFKRKPTKAELLSTDPEVITAKVLAPKIDTYIYLDVPAEKFLEMLEADSVGHFHAVFIKGKFSSDKVTE